MRCPVCGSRNVSKLQTGSYKCNDCGFVFYPDRDAIIDMRDMIDPSELSEEEMSVIGEHMAGASEDLGRMIYGEDIKNIFRGNVEIGEIAEKYSEEEKIYGVFIDFEGNLTGTILIILSEKDVRAITQGKRGMIHTLRSLARDAFMEFSNKLNLDAEIKRIDVAYDSITSMVNYLNGEMKKKKAFILNYELHSDGMWKGDIIIIPGKESLDFIKSLLEEDV